MSRENIEDRDDVLIESLNTVLFLVLGALAVSASLFLLVHAVVMVLSSPQSLSSLELSLVFAALSGVSGFASLHLFRTRRRLRKEKERSPFHHSR